VRVLTPARHLAILTLALLALTTRAQLTWDATTRDYAARPGESSKSFTFRGALDRPYWDQLYNHFAWHKGLSVPWTQDYAAAMRPDAGGGDYNPNHAGWPATGQSAPRWLRLTRTGNSIGAFVSTNGTSWAWPSAHATRTR
jgi:hypothetical protein